MALNAVGADQIATLAEIANQSQVNPPTAENALAQSEAPLTVHGDTVSLPVLPIYFQSTVIPPSGTSPMGSAQSMALVKDLGAFW